MSALWAWGLMPELSEPVHVAVPRPTRRRHRAVHVHQRLPNPVDRHLGVPVVGVREALIGAASYLDLDALRFPAMQAVLEGLVRPAELADSAGVPRRSLRVMRTIAEEAAAGAESGGEAKYWRLLQQSDMPTPTLQVWLSTYRGEKRVDAHWEEFDLATEIDSRTFHMKAAAFEADHMRQNALHAAGTLVLRYSVSVVMSDPAYVLLDTEMNLRARGWSG
jgi:very-short-patch-repair endonuclease